jgi:hypothetical protein
MKRSTNPYTPGAGKRPGKLAGRDPDLENFGLLLERLGDGRCGGLAVQPGTSKEFSKEF